MADHKRRVDDIYEHMELTPATLAQLKNDERPHWTIKERRALLRELIAHEDKLTTERIGALYTLQGFLFASFGLVLRAEFPSPLAIRIMITIIAIIGVTAARIYWQELVFNTAAITQILRDWHDLGQIHGDLSYPRIIGFVAKSEQRADGPRWLPRRAVPALFMIVWTVAAIVSWLPPLR